MTIQTNLSRPTDLAMTAVWGLSLFGLIDSLFNYFWTGNGIHGSEGALLVIVSTLLLVLAVGIVLNRWGPRWLHVTLEVLASGPHTLQVRGHAAVLDGRLIELPPGPMAVLRSLARRPGVVVSRPGLVGA